MATLFLPEAICYHGALKICRDLVCVVIINDWTDSITAGFQSINDSSSSSITFKFTWMSGAKTMFNCYHCLSLYLPVLYDWLLHESLRLLLFDFQRFCGYFFRKKQPLFYLVGCNLDLLLLKCNLGLFFCF